jgi:hypothetical protein
MQALASHETVTPSGPHPTDEELAAYIDRRLGAKDRARVTVHLASCDRCYSIFSGVVRFQLEEEEEMSKPAGGKVVPFDRETRRRRRHWWIPSTIAAALALVGIGLVSNVWSRSMTVAKLVAPVEGGQDVTERLWKHAIFRGAGPGDASSTELLELDRRAAVQAGALFVDFHLASAAGDAEKAGDRWEAISIAFSNSLAPDEARVFYDEATAIKKQGALSRVEKALAERERKLVSDDVVNPPYFRLGKWVEAGRLSAELEEPKFFDRWPNWIFLKLARAGWQLDLPDEVRKPLKAIDQAWGTKQYEALAEGFQGILDYYNFRP